MRLVVTFLQSRAEHTEEPRSRGPEPKMSLRLLQASSSFR